MINPFFKKLGPFEIDVLLSLSNINNSEKYSNFKISNIEDLLTAKNNSITFFHSKKYEELASKTKASFCITSKKLSTILPLNCKPIVVENVLIATAKITEIFYPSAIIDNFDQNVEEIKSTTFNEKVSYGINVLIGIHAT